MSQACEGMIRYKQAAAKCNQIIFSYRVTFKILLFYLPDGPPITSIPRVRLVEFLAGLQQESVAGPDGLAAHEAAPLRAKSLKNNQHHPLGAVALGVGQGTGQAQCNLPDRAPLIGGVVVPTITKEEVGGLLGRRRAAAKTEALLFCLSSDA